MVTYFLEPLCFPTQSGSVSLCWASSGRISGYNCRRIFRHIVNPRGAVILMKGLKFHVALSDITSFRNYKSVPPPLGSSRTILYPAVVISFFPWFYNWSSLTIKYRTRIYVLSYGEYPVFWTSKYRARISQMDSSFFDLIFYSSPPISPCFILHTISCVSQ